MVNDKNTPPTSPHLRVKPLEFRRLHGDWCADTIVGRYWIEEVQWKWQARLFSMHCNGVQEFILARGEGFEEAKAAAETDYEQRVLSALDTTREMGS